MTTNDFERIVTKIIKPLSNEILTSKNNELYQCVKLRKNFDAKLLKKVNKLILYIKKNVIISSNIDKHKMSACLMCAIVDYHPFTILNKGYNIENLLFANELLGIYSAVSLLENYTPGLKIVFPDTAYEAEDVDPYIRTLCTSLYIGKNNKQLKYNVMGYADTLFWLEKYTNEFNNITQ